MYHQENRLEERETLRQLQKRQAKEREAEYRALRRRAFETRAPREPTPPDPAKEKAHAWVAQGVEGLAKRAGREHVVLMATTTPAGEVGVGASIRCESMTAMNALGELVARVNQAFARDGVTARVYLRMRQVVEVDGRGVPK